MLTLTPPEIQAALDALADSAAASPQPLVDADSSFLIAKLASSQAETSAFELSEEEVELLLDMLPAPNYASDAAAPSLPGGLSLRAALHTFLRALRSRPGM